MFLSSVKRKEKKDCDGVTTGRREGPEWNNNKYTVPAASISNSLRASKMKQKWEKDTIE